MELWVGDRDEAEVSFLDVLAAKRSNMRFLNELSLRRAAQLLSSPLSIGLLMIPPSPEALGAGTATRHRLRSARLGFVGLLAHWSASTEVARTQAFLVQNIRRNQLERFSAKSGCASTIYAGPDTEGQVVLSHRGADLVLGQFEPAAIAGAIDEDSEARFLGFEYIAQTFVEALMRPLVPCGAPEKLLTKPATAQKL